MNVVSVSESVYTSAEGLAGPGALKLQAVAG